MSHSTAYRDGYWTGQLLLSLMKKVKTQRHVYKAFTPIQWSLIWLSVIIVGGFLYLSRIGGFKHKSQIDDMVKDVPVTASHETVYPDDSF
ncbi:hypothetical protein [Dickeya fangzhongdai]|uniref:hypothetical protein n=1 Tax=Dickeya fangzhongdai TaxID=1778540 RepID=UPI002B261F3E|nr:hypothetical protein [Dickeya fangzhongdai]WOY03121.1 hypothetical protein OGM21_14700 [Dickeya fangzhongdai]